MWLSYLTKTTKLTKSVNYYTFIQLLISIIVEVMFTDLCMAPGL